MKNKNTNIGFGLPYLYLDENFEHESPKQVSERVIHGAILRRAKLETPIVDDVERLTAFEESFKANHESIKGWLLSNKKGLIRNIQDAENVMQQLWIYAAETYTTSDMGVKKMLYNKAGLLASDYSRKRNRKPESLFTDLTQHEDGKIKEFSPDRIPSKGISPRKYTREDLWSKYSEIDLTDVQKEVIWLYGHEGLTFIEIEEKTGVKKSTACDWIKKSRKLFRASMKAVS